MERNYAIDAVKGLAIIGVVIIHARPFAEMRAFGIDGLYLTYLLDTAARFAVPFFFMAAGYLFGCRPQAGRAARSLVTYSSRLARLFFGWLLLYALYDAAMIVLKGRLGGSDVRAELAAYLSAFDPFETLYYGGGTSGYQLWYLPALMLSVAAIYAAERFRIFPLLLGAGLLLHLCGQFGQSYSGILALPFPTRDALFFGLFYTAMGYAFARRRFAWFRPGRFGLRTLAAIGAAALLLMYVERFVLVYALEGALGDYWVTTIALSFALFHIVLLFPEAGRRTYLSDLGRNSAGIYVLHVGVINAAQLVLLAAQFEHVRQTLLWNAAFAPAVLLVSHYAYRMIAGARRASDRSSGRQGKAAA